MPNIAAICGALLFALGPIFYFLGEPGHRSPTAFIPSLFGVFILAFGLAAKTPSRTKAAMHGAVGFAFLGLLGSLMGAKKWPLILTGQTELVARPLAAWSQLLMFAICLVFVVLSVNWFIKNRRAKSN
ncbi:hypothetical protein EON80_01710 [bacterium]|nr:MAG: hypothetical protein EON80_01710 [bacterium]